MQINNFDNAKWPAVHRLMAGIRPYSHQAWIKLEQIAAGLGVATEIELVYPAR